MHDGFKIPSTVKDATCAGPWTDLVRPCACSKGSTLRKTAFLLDRVGPWPQVGTTLGRALRVARTNLARLQSHMFFLARVLTRTLRELARARMGAPGKHQCQRQCPSVPSVSIRGSSYCGTITSTISGREIGTRWTLRETL